jgi:hypothetical protein
MIKPFKITNKHLNQYGELSKYDVGLYAIKIKKEQPLMIYETENVAQKAFEYFENMLKKEN